MIKLKEGQKVYGTDGKQYLIEKGDFLQENDAIDFYELYRDDLNQLEKNINEIRKILNNADDSLFDQLEHDRNPINNMDKLQAAWLEDMCYDSDKKFDIKKEYNKFYDGMKRNQYKYGTEPAMIFDHVYKFLMYLKRVSK